MGDEQAAQSDTALTVANAKISQLESDLIKEKELSKSTMNWNISISILMVIAGLIAAMGWGSSDKKEGELKAAQGKLTQETEKSGRLLEFGERMKNIAQEYYLKAGGDTKYTRWDAEKQAFVESEKMSIKPESLQMSGARHMSGVEAMKYVFGDQCFENALRDSARIQPLLKELARYELLIIPVEEKGKRMFFLLQDGKVAYSGTYREETNLKGYVGEKLLYVVEMAGRKMLEVKQPEANVEPPSPIKEDKYYFTQKTEEAEYDFTPQIEATFFEHMSQEDTQKMLKVLNEQKRQYQAELNKLYRKNLKLEKKLK
ncbi:MAG: hypothetical protein AAB345_01210 [Patescibacteria group bacterium]